MLVAQSHYDHDVLDILYTCRTKKYESECRGEMWEHSKHNKFIHFYILSLVIS